VRKAVEVALETVRSAAAGKKARRDEMDDEPPPVDSSPGEGMP